MTDDNREVIIEMIDIFIEQVSEFTDEMEQCLKKGNFKALSEVAHKAKSSVAIMGMESLLQELNELEMLAGEGKGTDKYVSYINDFRQQCAEAVRELKEYKSQL